MPMPCSRRPRTILTTSSLAPTSMPRVGSLSTSTRGRWVSHLASATFCWLPPDSVPSARLDVGRADAQPLDVAARDVALGGRAQPEPVGCARGSLIVMFLNTGSVREQHHAPAFRHEGDAGAPRPCRADAGRTLRPSIATRPRSGGSLPNSVRASSSCPQPMKP